MDTLRLNPGMIVVTQKDAKIWRVVKRVNENESNEYIVLENPFDLKCRQVLDKGENVQTLDFIAEYFRKISQK